ncbi:aldehyde dehydrogenase [Marinomonas piezotolerans]|uniref:Aldehyde dehydrogenase n=1 Tax=Marinomonas piezotolerans TaxID=2213058 RepID=A0A370UD29_9GAMM|nr:aldehyde dehydrogenase family protein [Marinomonas piezotolerans]RDL45651.1 aldehyde dehydrogenase [Marinomonas piezotolerans]
MTTYSLMSGSKKFNTTETFSVINPSTLAPVGECPKATVDDLHTMIAESRKAFESWSAIPYAERQAYINQIADALEKHSEELASIITQEQGKPIGASLGSMFEMGGAVAWTRYTASLELPVKVLQDDENGHIELHRRPIGVVASITPWNWPVMIAIWHIIPAILAGNTVICKPSPYTPLSTLRMIEIMNGILPQGVVSSISGGDELGAAISDHPGIDKIVFTGSTETGKKVMSSSAKSLKNLTLELGGNDAGIVLGDCNPDEIAPGLFWGAFINNGQTCAAMKRLYVHRSIYKEVCDSLTAFSKSVKMGDGFADGAELGPIQNKMQFNIVNQLVKSSIEQGGNVLLGGPLDSEDTLFFPITLVAVENNDNALVQNEQFGPALPIIPFDTVEEAIKLANDSSAGLGGSVWSNDKEAAAKIAEQMECGTVWLNKHGAIQPNAPFGGVKSSGLGVEFGEEGLLANTTIQCIFS